VLEQQIRTELGPARRVLLAGCGGGYDVLGAVPLLHELRAQGQEVHLASLSFTALKRLPGAAPHPETQGLFAIHGGLATETMYCPEAWLARWLGDRGGPATIWCLEKMGVVPLARAYQWLVGELGIDAIILVDGGIDAILRGDESSLGTPEEDLASTVAVATVTVPTKIIGCVGFGAEVRDGICHAQVLARIAELTRAGAFLGCTALGPHTSAAHFYRDAYDFVAAHQTAQRGSHIHSLIRQALDGEFGARGPHLWLSPLLTLFWFFRLPPVVDTHAFAAHLARTETIGEVTMLIDGLRKSVKVRERESIPI
jgi:hypothetical protein